jgi:hypothetical protein
VLAETDGHAPIQTYLDHDLAAAFSRIDRLVQLVTTVLEAHRVIVGHRALLLQAQDRCHVETGSQRPVCVAGRAWWHAEHAVVLGQQAAIEHGVGLEDRPNLGQTQLLDHPILGGAEGALHAPLGLRAARPDQLRIQFAQSPAELRLRAGQGAALILRLEDAVSVGVQGEWTAVGLQPTLQQVEVIDDGVGVVEAGQQAAGGVIDHVDQDHVLAAALGPVVDRRVHLHQFAEAGAARPATPVLFAAALGLPEALGQQPAPQCIRGDLQAPFGQFLGGEGGAEIVEVLAVDLQDAAAELGILAVVGGLAAQAVDQSGIAALLQALQQSAQVSGGEAQQASGLHLGTLPVEHRVQDAQTITFPLTHGDPVSFVGRGRHGSSLPGAGRTFLSR